MNLAFGAGDPAGWSRTQLKLVCCKAWRLCSNNNDNNNDDKNNSYSVTFHKMSKCSLHHEN